MRSSSHQTASEFHGDINYWNIDFTTNNTKIVTNGGSIEFNSPIEATDNIEFDGTSFVIADTTLTEVLGEIILDGNIGHHCGHFHS